jgi:ATP-dependent Zn protease
MADEHPAPPPAPAPDAPAPPRRKVLLTPEEELVAKAAGVRWPMAKDTLDPMNLPYHEAGHTLVGLALGRPLNYVSIEPGDQMSDFEPLTGTDRASVERWIKTALGGPMAEQRRFGVSWGCKTDIASIRHEIATNITGVEELGFVGELAREVERLLTVHEEDLHRLARELFDKKRLTGEEVTKLVTVEANP